MVARKVTHGKSSCGRHDTPVVALTGLDASPTMKSVGRACRRVVARVARDGDGFALRRAEAGEILF